MFNPLFRRLPWSFVARRIARAHGFLDPVALLGRLHLFSQPALIRQPVELLRAGLVFHARGLLNTQAIQHNMDWIWPYWVERQFDPLDDAFLPRAFSITHVNLTLRNWTAIGTPDADSLPIVDPRGLLTPFWDGWSLDAWIIGSKRELDLFPSRARNAAQEQTDRHGLSVRTLISSTEQTLELASYVIREGDELRCVHEVSGLSIDDAWLVIGLRPYNPEGVSLVQSIQVESDGKVWKVNGTNVVHFDEAPISHRLSNYKTGDVWSVIQRDGISSIKADEKIKCDVGLATAAAIFSLKGNEPRKISLEIPLSADQKPLQKRSRNHPMPAYVSWSDALKDAAKLEVPDLDFQNLYLQSLRTLILHTPGDVYPGPYTYKRFWFRDATFILHALLLTNLGSRFDKCIESFLRRQTRAGYFLSQEGEWDSNGQVLWLFARYFECEGRHYTDGQLSAISRAANWIVKKRTSSKEKSQHAGLLPAGFSAEHLGPADFYYWDNYWAVAGLESAHRLLIEHGGINTAQAFMDEAKDLRQAINTSIEKAAIYNNIQAIPASPYRRLDAGAIGSIVCSYPLNLVEPKDPMLLGTLEFLIENCFLDDAFFQDMIHSGLNCYLTLHIAQALLRAKDPRFFKMTERVAALASPTGQWPEAIHPRTLGGCMGDGQHAWASAEWVSLIRNMFVQEGGHGLILLSGIPEHWTKPGSRLFFGPTPTPYGRISLSADVKENSIQLSWTANWHSKQPMLVVRIPGWQEGLVCHGETAIIVYREKIGTSIPPARDELGRVEG